MRQMLGPGALGRPRGIGWRGRWERGLGWGIYVTPWLIHVNVWQNPLQCCEVISLQLIKINEKKKSKTWLHYTNRSPRCGILLYFCFLYPDLTARHKTINNSLGLPYPKITTYHGLPSGRGQLEQLCWSFFRTMIQKGMVSWLLQRIFCKLLSGSSSIFL